jgi:hypothetical protein
MKTVPPTSPERYVTGFDALNIPLSDGSSADWHFHAAFIESASAARVAGIDRPDTNGIFGRYGVRECGRELRRCGHVGTVGEVWAADFVRAILDLVYASVASGHRPDHVDVDDMLDSEADRRDLAARLADLKASVSDRARALVEEWEARQEWVHR